MKARKSAIQPWLSCPYNENTLVDLPSSVWQTKTGQKSTYCVLGSIGCAILEVVQQAIVVCISPHQVDMKNIVKR